MRVLMIMNNAPDYREPFLREVGREIDLTVVARPCEPDNLVAPQERKGYTYRELDARRTGGLVWQPDLSTIIDEGEWDVICSSINMRDVGRIRIFQRRRDLHARWIWWGHIFGKTPLPGLAAVRGALLRRSAGALVFNEGIAQDVRERYGISARSFNNTQVRLSEFRPGVFSAEHPAIHLLFVGRNQPRKHLDRLVALAQRRVDIVVRLIGPGMESLTVPSALEETGRVERLGRIGGDLLKEHFDWSDLIVNPGHVGLLVMHTAQHGKGIVIDSSSDHAPEYWLAEEADQPFIDFSQVHEVDRFFQELITAEDRSDRLRAWGGRLQAIAKERYTIEHMAQVHLEMFREVVGRSI